MKARYRHYLNIFFAVIVLQSCAANSKYYGDGRFILHKKYIFPRYELIFPTTSTNNNSVYKYNVNKLNSQESLVGVKIEVHNKACIDIKLTNIKNTFLKLVLLDGSGDVVVESNVKFESWRWSYSEYNPTFNKSSSCFLYMGNTYFIPKRNEKYSLIVEIKNATETDVMITPVIKSTAVYLP